MKKQNKVMPKTDLRAELTRLRRQNSRLKAQLMVDDLTGLYNARCLQQRLQRCLSTKSTRSTSSTKATKSAKSTKSSDKVRPALLFLDVDHFKEINLAHGHLAASRILNQVGQLIGRVIRSTDVGFRYGGDEFVVLVTGGAQGARVMGERIRTALAAHTFCETGLRGPAEIRLTVSVGVRVIQQNDTVQAVIEAADRAMYEAKRLSRNAVVRAS